MQGTITFESSNPKNPELVKVASSFRRAFSYVMGIPDCEQMPNLSRNLDLLVRKDDVEIRVTLFIVVSKDTPDEKFDSWFAKGIPAGYARTEMPLKKTREIMDDGPVTVVTGSLIHC